ncbi:hypothetical protein ABZ366_09100 [Streptomyces sp. NPDC005904]|uniref:hypothetical protein n=1 Tax=Streptomyces sp. NPDC005904 TaxID=3154570 RepID=UPI0033C94BA8
MDFYVAATLRNEVAGIPLGAPPEAWEEGLGDDFLDDIQRSYMRRDYGLIEIAFIKRAGLWESVSTSLQIHRLAHGIDGVVPLSLARSYGDFSRHVGFDTFRTALQAQGGALEEVDDLSMGGFNHFREATARSSVYVVKEPPHDGLEPDVLWSIVKPWARPAGPPSAPSHAARGGR